MKNKTIDLFSGNEVIQNEGQKYSDMLNDLVLPFENDFPDEMDMYDIIGFAANAWNLGCLSMMLPKKEFGIFLESNYFPEPENTILKKMIDLKKKKFAKYDRFIEDYQLKEKKGELVLTVLTMEKKAFLDRLVEEMPDDEELKEGFINRYAIVIKPLQPCIDWLNALSPDCTVVEPDEANIYLVNDGIYNIEQWLRKNYDKFFMMELEDWNANKKKWPQKRDRKSVV